MSKSFEDLIALAIRLEINSRDNAIATISNSSRFKRNAKFRVKIRR